MLHLGLLSVLLLPQAPPPQPASYRVERGDVVLTLRDRGVFEPVKKTDLVCQVRTSERRDFAAHVLWLVEDGATVKKGELVVRLDASALRERLQEQELALEQARAALMAAEKEREVTAARVRFDLDSAKANWELAQLDTDEAKNDADKKRAAIKLRLARAGVDLARLEADVRITKADALLAPARAAITAAEARVRAVQEDLGRCEIVAPHDGVAVHIVPEGGRFGGSVAVVAPGEPVKEGQKLLTVYDPARFQLRVKVPEALVNRVQVGLPVTVASPLRPLQGKVASIATIASAADWLKADVKVYDTVITFAADTSQFRPEMTATVTAKLAERQGVLRVPVRCINLTGRQSVCTVREIGADKPVPVKIGLVGNDFVEIRDGLREGDEALPIPPGPDEVRRQPSVNPEKNPARRR